MCMNSLIFLSLVLQRGVSGSTSIEEESLKPQILWFWDMSDGEILLAKAVSMAQDVLEEKIETGKDSLITLVWVSFLG